MRISGVFLGIVAFVGLIVITGGCAVVSYGFTRDAVISSWQAGIPVESVGEVVQSVINPVEISANATPTHSGTSAPVVIPSLTAATSPIATADSNSNAVISPIPTMTATPMVTATEAFAAQRWRDPREINILLMGIDERVGFTTDRAYRTDTMMVLHVDPVRETAAVISFPRDLYVTVPNYGQNRLNRANYIGDGEAYPNGGGPGLLMETINSNFGIRIDFYVMINFTVFETAIDRLAPDGIEVCIDEYINDPTYPDAGFGTIEVAFEIGCQRLDGTHLLQYARTRKTQGGDIDRTRRQQQVIEATRQHVLSAGGIQAFITQAGGLWNDLSGSYRTNLTLNQITSLAFTLNDIDDITYTSLSAGYWQPQTLANGDQVLVPIPSEIQRLIQETFYPGAALSIADYRALADQENVPIRVFNNTTISGLAGNTNEYLLGLGVSVGEVGNMPSPNNSRTVIQYYGAGSRDTANYVAAVLGLTPDRVQRGNDGLAVDGVIVAVGSDIQEIIASDRRP